MLNSPSNGTFGPTPYPTSVWGSYLGAVAAQTDMVLSGVTEHGEPDANGIWHNSQYYSYTVSTRHLQRAARPPRQATSCSVPTRTARPEGYILINEATLQSNLYAAGQGTMSIWQDSGFTQPYDVPGSAPFGSPETNVIGLSANEPWGNLLTPLFTGFTAGYSDAFTSPNTMMPATASAANLGSSPSISTRR